MKKILQTLLLLGGALIGWAQETELDLTSNWNDIPQERAQNKILDESDTKTYWGYNDGTSWVKVWSSERIPSDRIMWLEIIKTLIDRYDLRGPELGFRDCQFLEGEYLVDYTVTNTQLGNVVILRPLNIPAWGPNQDRTIINYNGVLVPLRIQDKAAGTLPSGTILRLAVINDNKIER